MKSWGWAVALLLVCGVGTGCSGFWKTPSNSGGGTTTTTLSSGYFYVLDQATDTIIAYDISSGTLTKVGSYAVPAAPVAMVISPNKSYLYVSATDTTLGAIYVYGINADGSLTPKNTGGGSTPGSISNDLATAMRVDVTNSWLIEASGSGYLNAIPLDTSTGLPSTSRGNCAGSQTVVCSVALTGSTIKQIAIAPNNSFVFVAASTNGTAEIGFNAAASGTNSPFTTIYSGVGLKNANGGANAVAVDAGNRMVYIGEAGAASGSGGLRAFTLNSNTGALTEIAGSPFASGASGPSAILSDPLLKYVYVANWNGTSAGVIKGFTVAASGSSYTLTATGSTVAAGVRPASMVEDSKGNFVLVENAGGGPYLQGFIFDTTTAGQLDLAISDSSFAGVALGAQ